MNNLLRMELKKIKKSKSLILLTLFNILMYILLTIGFDKAGSFKGMDTLNYLIPLMTGITTINILGVSAVVVVCNEFSSGFIKHIISKGHKRKDIYLVKLRIANLYMLIYSFIVPILGLVFNTINNGYGEKFTVISLISIIKSLGLGALLHFSITSIFVMFAFVFQKSIKTMVAVFLLDATNRIINFLYVNNQNIKNVIDPLGFINGKVFFADDISGMRVILGCLFLMGVIIISTTIGIRIFEKSDIVIE